MSTPELWKLNFGGEIPIWIYAARGLELMTKRKYLHVLGAKTNQWPNFKLRICHNFSRTFVSIPNVGNLCRLNCSKVIWFCNLKFPLYHH